MTCSGLHSSELHTLCRYTVQCEQMKLVLVLCAVFGCVSHCLLLSSSMQGPAQEVRCEAT